MKIPRRRKTPAVQVGKIFLGSRHPIVIQAMTNTPTADIAATVNQTALLIDSGAEMIRWTINDERAAQAAPEIIRILRGKGYEAPLIGDFHFNGHILLTQYPQLARMLDKYRINPGNVGRGKNRDENFNTMIKTAVAHNKAVRIGVNWGSLDPELLKDIMDKNSRKKNPKNAREIMSDAMIKSALSSAQQALRLGLCKEKLVLSVKLSDLPDMVFVYERLAKECDFALHLGLTEAGGGLPGVVSSSAALALLLQQGIGDTIRVSLSPEPEVSRAREVEVCQALLQSMGLRHFRPTVISCPGCGRTNCGQFQELAGAVNAHIQKNISSWRKNYPGVEKLKIAIMGCVVNGPGESRHADIGISLPGVSEEPSAFVYIHGKKHTRLKGNNIQDEFIRILEEYIAKRFPEG
ncbi:MAG: flavodoxin-dependent (E)-4-hydroxy-3-methylbut-2-enyl-diphosphate synthase [Candidatus Omnitrophota bacterium]